jgi:hypothetical protein
VRMLIVRIGMRRRRVLVAVRIGMRVSGLGHGYGSGGATC